MASLSHKALNVSVACATLLPFVHTDAKAACGATASGGGVGAPSISATEISTSQALELLRKRRDETMSGSFQLAQNVPPAPPAATPLAPPAAAPPAPPAAAPPAPPAATALPPAASTQPPAAASPPSVAAKPVAPKPAQPPVAGGSPAAAKVVKAKPAPGSIPRVQPSQQRPIVFADPGLGSAAAPLPLYSAETLAAINAGTRQGVWAQLFGDKERHEGLTFDGGARGELTSRRTTTGFVGGGDVRIADGPAGSKFFLGALGSYVSGTGEFNDLRFQRPVTQPGGVPATQNALRSDAKEDVDGGGGGIYGFMTANRFSMDFLAKVEGYDLVQSDTLLTNCAPGFDQTERRRGAVDFTTATVAGNINYRFDLSPTTYFEPTFGLRYTNTQYGNETGNLPFGFIDGDALRVQVGARFGFVGQLPDGAIGVATLTGLLYNDVVINGFSRINQLGFNPADVDEGQTRALGQLTLTRIGTSGFTYSLTGEVRGGEDVIGFGGKALVRYDW